MLVYTDVCKRAWPTDDNPLRVETCSGYNYMYFIYYSILGQRAIQVTESHYRKSRSTAKIKNNETLVRKPQASCKNRRENNIKVDVRSILTL